MGLLRHFWLIFQCVDIYVIFGLGLLWINLFLRKQYFGLTEPILAKRKFQLKSLPWPEWVWVLASFLRGKKLQN
jgi:hypothetical protein